MGILARRTSPTNIGMALLCCLAAADLDLCGKKKAAELVGHILDNLEKLPRWDFGHFYNWYDTSTAIPLEPRYVSTVDSGNLCGSLIALREGLAEWGEAALAERAGALADAIDFSVLYDRSRRLFTIGYDCSKETYTQGWYDLMASEARQTSFLAVARGEVEQRHWRRLSRMLVGQDHYSGMASWTGTMFEYFMPHLLLPAYENSLLYESLTFCVYAQKKRTAGHAPWGISESCFFAFDAAMNYQYKAHGVQRLGLKRGLDRELVVSPYSSFLALATAPRSAVKNLRRLRELGLGGPYGLYESADFTESRLTGKRPFESVRTYMAHHLGMSLLSIDNALNGQTMQKRFMRDASMSAYRELLQEKVPVGARIMRAPRREIPEKPRRDRYGAFQRSGEGWAAPPECHILSGGAWNVLCTDGGCARSVMGKTAITRCEFQSPYEAAGVSFFLKLDGKLISLTPAPLYQKDTVYSWMFRAASVQWTARKGEVRTALTLRVPEQETGEVWEAGVIWKGQHEVCAELVCYLEPILAKQQDYAAHPAFSKLSIESAAQDDGVLFTRRPRRRGESRPALAVAWNSADASYDTSREKGLGRGGLKALELALGREAAGSAGAVLDPCLLARFPLILFPGQEASVRVALSASDSGEFAWSAAQRLLKLPARGEPGRLDRIIRSDNLTSGETLHAFELLRRMEFPPGGGIRQGSEKQRSLWPHGISGDLPVTAVRVEDQDGAEKCMRLVKEHQLLARCGYAFDLVFLLSEGGDYHRPIRAALTEGLKKLDWHHKLGTRGGVHLVEAEGLAATVTLENDGGLPPLQSEPIRFDPPGVFEQKPGMPPWRLCMDGMFVFDTGEQLPPVGWSMMLCNERFGWMTDETGNGHLWYQNARENQLTPWHNDPLRIGGEDAPVLHTGSRACAFLAAPDGNPCTVTYGKGTAAWKKEWNGLTLRCTAFVPPELDARILILEGAKGQVSMGSRSWPMEEVLWLKTDGSGTEPMEPDQNLLNRTRSYWERLTSRLSIRTPDSALNQYLNGWALYQVIACRLFGRTSLYQNGGAYGFRDQLQDVCAVLLTAPELARAQILRACAHQYAEGDVQHWWHPALGESPEKGVRTRISDDLLW
ncbi:MAG: hypothetical protein EOM52_10450, partial [Clostridia bacterium]|nr:hypothetical protein [Clostridia bacterium]